VKTLSSPIITPDISQDPRLLAARSVRWRLRIQ